MNIFSLLKAIGCFLVFFLHFSYITTSTLGLEMKQIPMFLCTPAWTGVWIFFIVSGYLIGKKFFTQRYKCDNFKDFAIFMGNRIIKILPLYILIILIDVCFVNTDYYFHNSEFLMRILTFRLRNPYADNMTGVLWFISTIFQMYLLTPLVWKLIINPITKLKNNKIVFCITFLTLITTYLKLRYYWWNNNVSWDYYILCNVAANIDLYFGGFIFAAFYNSKDTIVKKFLRPISILIFVCFIAFNTYLMYQCWAFGIGQKFLKLAIPTITIVLVLALIYAFDIKHTESCSKKLFYDVVNYLGMISFGIYCWHSPIMFNLVKTINISQTIHWQLNLFNLTTIKITIAAFKANLFINALLGLILTLIWAILTYYLIEKPFSKFKFK